jgi:hypothetical protein
MFTTLTHQKKLWKRPLSLIALTVTTTGFAGTSGFRQLRRAGITPALAVI